MASKGLSEILSLGQKSLLITKICKPDDLDRVRVLVPLKKDEAHVAFLAG